MDLIDLEELSARLQGVAKMPSETRTQAEIWESDEPCWACEGDGSCAECRSP